MKVMKVISVIFGAIGLFAAALAVSLSLMNRNAQPVLIAPPEEAEEQVTALMGAICQGDFDQVSALLLGNPSLGIDREPEDEVGKLIWNAFTDSLSYELVGQCHATDDGLTQNVQLTCLDITSVTANLRDRSQKLLEERVENALDTSEIYNDSYEYREEFVMQVLYDAAVMALEEDGKQMTVELTLNLVYRQEHWWVVADNALLDVISGGILY